MKNLQFMVALINNEDVLFVFTKDTGITLQFVDDRWEISAYMYYQWVNDINSYYCSYEYAMEITNNITPFEELEKCGYFLDK